MSTFDWKSQVVVITGASAGIGASLARAIGRRGGSLVLAARREKELKEVAESTGTTAATVVTDVTKRADVQRLAADAIARFGHVDVWVNNAGADVLTGEARSWPDERKLEVLVDVDLKATIRCSRLVAERMRPGGSILNIGWDHATVDGMAGDNPELFAAVKGGILGFSKSFARSVAPGVRVNVLCPGWVETAYGAGVDRGFYERVAAGTPLGRWGRPEDIAGAAVWLASPAAAFVTGQAINVNGGTVG